MKTVTIRAALQHVADNPLLPTDELIQVPVWELVAHSLYDIANNPDEKIRGSFGRANKARQMILNRLVGRRKPGTHPAASGTVEVEFADLTGGELNGSPGTEGPVD